MVGIKPLEPGNIAQNKLAGPCRAKLHEGLHGGEKRCHSTLKVTWIQSWSRTITYRREGIFLSLTSFVHFSTEHSAMLNNGKQDFVVIFHEHETI